MDFWDSREHQQFPRTEPDGSGREASADFQQFPRTEPDGCGREAPAGLQQFPRTEPEGCDGGVLAADQQFPRTEPDGCGREALAGFQQFPRTPSDACGRRFPAAGCRPSRSAPSIRRPVRTGGRAFATAILPVVLALGLLGSPAAAQAPDRSTRPALGPVPTLDLPDPARFTLANGLEVVVLEKREVPLVQVNLHLRAGSVHDAPGRSGIASMTANMLDEGAGGKSALELADAFEMLGARFGTGAGVHTASVSLRVPVERLSEAAALMSDVVLRPDFPENELERLRTEALTSLIRLHDQPNAIASVLFSGTLFGAEHPYGRRTTEASLRALTIADLRAFHEQFYRPGNATVFIVGAIAPAEARRIAEAAFGGWATGVGATPRATIPTADQVTGRTVYLVDKPGAVQSVIAIGRIGVARDNPDVYALEVLNTILGGSFTSRLNQNLREDKGYTYGASSFFDFGLAPGAFRAGAAVQTQSTGPALAEFMVELNRILEPIPEEEVDRARKNLAMSFIQGFQASSQIAAQLADVEEYGLPADYLDSYVDRIMAVTKADVERVADRYLDPANLAIVVVGDRSRIEEQIRALDLGDVKVLTVVDVLGPVPVVARPTS